MFIIGNRTVSGSSASMRRPAKAITLKRLFSVDNMNHPFRSLKLHRDHQLVQWAATPAVAECRGGRILMANKATIEELRKAAEESLEDLRKASGVDIEAAKAKVENLRGARQYDLMGKLAEAISRR